MTETEFREAIDALLVERYQDRDLSMGAWVLAVGEIDFDDPTTAAVEVITPEHQSGLASSGVIRLLEDATRGGWGDDA